MVRATQGPVKKGREGNIESSISLAPGQLSLHLSFFTRPGLPNRRVEDDQPDRSDVPIALGMDAVSGRGVTP